MRWKKKNGNEFKTNDDQATIDYCESLGMSRLSEPEKIDGPAPNPIKDLTELTADEIMAYAKQMVNEGNAQEANRATKYFEERQASA